MAPALVAIESLRVASSREVKHPQPPSRGSEQGERGRSPRHSTSGGPQAWPLAPAVTGQSRLVRMTLRAACKALCTPRAASCWLMAQAEGSGEEGGADCLGSETELGRESGPAASSAQL